MNIRNIIIPVATLFTVANTSCNRDLLEPVPQTSIADVTAFNSAKRIEGQVLGLYAALKSGNFYGGRYVIYGDIRGANFMLESENLVTGSDVWRLNATNSATAVVNLWSSAYYAINSTNVFLEGMATTGTAVVGDALAKNYIAEAKAIRAICYFSLVQYFAKPYASGGTNPGLPLRLTAIKGTGQSVLARSSVADVYNQILKDLNEAEADLPLSYSAAGTNVTRIHRNTAIALKTRVYLAMQQYDKVITEANKIVSATAPFKANSGVAHQLYSDITTYYKNYTNTEAMLSMPMSTTSGDFPGTQNQLAYYFTKTVGDGLYSLNPAGIISDAGWTDTDKRKTFITTTGTKKYMTKFTLPSPFTDYVPVIRYAEVLLNLAEARARTNNSVDAQALALLNAVRQRSDAAVTLAPASATALIDAIMKERDIEFIGEGMNALDRLRLLKTLVAKGDAQAKNPGETGYIWPISSTELNLNTACVDN